MSEKPSPSWKQDPPECRAQGSPGAGEGAGMDRGALARRLENKNVPSGHFPHMSQGKSSAIFSGIMNPFNKNQAAPKFLGLSPGPHAGTHSAPSPWSGRGGVTWPGRVRRVREDPDRARQERRRSDFLHRCVRPGGHRMSHWGSVRVRHRLTGTAATL